jgi:hypothetical protein
MNLAGKTRSCIWSERIIGFLKNEAWVFETGQEHTAVNVVKLLAEIPLVFCVVDLKAAVLRNTSQLENHFWGSGTERHTSGAEWR